VLRMTLAASVAGGVAVLLQFTASDVSTTVLALETLLPFGVVYLIVSSMLGEGISVRRS
jgi:hypothetical protein